MAIGRPIIVKPNQKNILFRFFDMLPLKTFWSCMRGTFIIIMVKALMLNTRKVPTIMYSWKTAETVKVRRRAISELHPLRTRGK